MKRVGTAGIVLGVLGLIAAVIFGVVSVTKVVDGAQGFADSAMTVRGSGQVSLDGGQDYSFFAGGTSAMQCEVTQPDGASAPVRPPGSSIEYETRGVAWRKVFELTASQSGSYTVSCTANDPVVAVPGSGAGLLGSAFGIVGAVLLGGAAMVVLVVGLVLRIVGGGKAKRGAAQPGRHQPGPPPPYGTT